MAATKFTDALARCPGNDGEDSDAVAAYTHAVLDDIAHLLRKGNKFLDTWVAIPRNRLPES